MSQRAARSSATAVAIRHVAFEDLGSLADRVRARGYRVRYAQAGVDRLDAARDADLVVVLGGPIGAYEDRAYPFIRDELALIEARLAADRPTLGICLGAQLMARALGANVYPGGGKEIGWSVPALTEAGHASPLRELEGAAVLHWHGDTFDMPPKAIRLASTDAYANQAFSWGRRGLALQFHAEVRGRDLERWYVGHACELASTRGLAVDALRADGARLAPELQSRAVRLWDRWLSTLD